MRLTLISKQRPFTTVKYVFFKMTLRIKLIFLKLIRKLDNFFKNFFFNPFIKQTFSYLSEIVLPIEKQC